MNTADGKKISGNEVNTYFLINIIFEGNAHRALDVARRFPQTSYMLAPTSVERYLIVRYIKDGVPVDEIKEALTREGHTVSETRIQRLKKEYDLGKYRD